MIIPNISIKFDPRYLVDCSSCVLLSVYLFSFVVGEHWEGKGTSQPSFYMGGKWLHWSGCFYCVFSKRLWDYSIFSHNYLFCTEFNWRCLASIRRSCERTIYVSISSISIIFHLLVVWQLISNSSLLFLPFDRGEDGVSGVLLHHKQVIKPY